MQVDYDAIAAAYEARYERSNYPGVERALTTFVLEPAGPAQPDVLEVGCGTGHWLRLLRGTGVDAVGIDLSGGMLAVARKQHPDARLIRGRADTLPWVTGSFDRIFCVNALHHFTDRAAFFREGRRLLRDGGGLMTIGLDPHAGRDQWWIYDYFPTTLVEDRRRYSATGSIRELMAASGFSSCETREVQHITAQMSVSDAIRRGFLDRTSTSQFMMLSRAEYEAGVNRIRVANPGEGSDAALRTDLRLYGTTGWIA